MNGSVSTQGNGAQATGRRAKIGELIEASRRGHQPEGHHRLDRMIVYSLRLSIQVVKLWYRDNCPQKAASLAFASALSIVPMLGIGLVTLKLTGALEAQSSLVTTLAKQILPDVQRSVIVDTLVKFTNNISPKSVGIPGLLSVLVVSFMLFYNIEGIFNDIWRIHAKRKLATKFLIFYCLITLVPPLLGYSLYHMTTVTDQSDHLSYMLAATGTLASLFLANKLLPATRVLIIPALVGSVFGAVMLEVAKSGFRLYVSEVAFESYSGVYGRFGLVPIFLVWIYLSWLIVLLSAEISHAIQNLPALERERSLHGGAASAHDLDDELVDRVNGLTAVELMLRVAMHYQSGGKAMLRSELCRQFAISEDVVERIFRRLKKRHLAIELEGQVIGYLPARPASEISIADVLDAFRPSDATQGSTERAQSALPTSAEEAASAPHPQHILRAIIRDLQLESQRRTEEVTLDDLIHGRVVVQ